MLRRITVDGFDFHNLSSPDPKVQVKIDGLEGISNVARRVASDPNSGTDGITISDILSDARILSFPGVVRGSDFADFRQQRKQVISACSVRRDIYGLPVPKRIELETLDGVVYFTYGQPTRSPLGLSYNTWADLFAQFTCEDPLLYLDSLQSTGPVSVPIQGGVEYPVSYPAIYGAATGGTGAAYNDGDADVWPMVYLRGAMLNPSFTYQQGGGLFSLNYELGANDVVVIDMREGTVILNDTISLAGYKTDDSDFFTVAPGDVSFSFSTGRSSDTGTLEAKFYPAVVEL